MSYHRRHALGQAALQQGPAWYRAMGSVSSQPPQRRVGRSIVSLGSLGTDEPPGGTLSTPTLADPATVQWQANVLAQLSAGVETMRKAELQKWLQIAATLAIPLSAAVWRAIFKRGIPQGVT